MSRILLPAREVIELKECPGAVLSVLLWRCMGKGVSEIDTDRIASQEICRNCGEDATYRVPTIWGPGVEVRIGQPYL